MSKKIKILLIFAISLFLVACGYTQEEKALMKSYEENGKVNAVTYIENKYGFTPTVTGVTVLKVDPGPVPDFSPSATGMVNVKMEYEGKEFLVNISGEDPTKEGKDNYQKDEIEKAFAEQLEKDLAIKIATIDMQYAMDCMLTKKYTDVDSFMETMKDSSIISVYVKTFDDVSESTVENITSDSMALLVISCRDQECLDVLSDSEYLNKHNYKQNFYRIDYLDNKLMEYSFYMKGYVFRSAKGDVGCKLYAAKKVEDGVYIVYDETEGAEGVTITETTDMAPTSAWKKDSGYHVTLPTFENPEKVSKSYAIDFGKLSKMQIYIKQEDKNSTDTSQRAIAMQYIDENGQEVLTHEYPILVQGYYSLTLDRQEDMRIAVMKNKK